MTEDQFYSMPLKDFMKYTKESLSNYLKFIQPKEGCDKVKETVEFINNLFLGRIYYNLQKNDKFVNNLNTKGRINYSICAETIVHSKSYANIVGFIRRSLNESYTKENIQAACDICPDIKYAEYKSYLFVILPTYYGYNEFLVFRWFKGKKVPKLFTLWFFEF